ncbi:hypothetical protein CROQUDRAFT_662905 [Cronartium quercuum f. sp. fusiforme G11]|uniref:Holocytochrome c-type synthase n=1 Tax=Cronartium quercuum f. sp. fusiforme G11 TaxID=708437 RepID=A0A9P6N9M0_9BASI|nr:hypothetical protein CROQUDRAFT_662905 [Cronartium quercuum f. sp. fusiforme G11]
MWPFSISSSTETTTNQATCPLGHNKPIPSHNENQQDPINLPTEREISSIPRYQENTEEQSNWVYPSPAQFYTALTRKKQDAKTNRLDMYTVVPIHNAVNEKVWQEVLEWESNYGKGSFERWPRSGKSGPMLCSFRGRPNDRSPRAWLKVLSGYQAPFDRHDWEVIRPTETRMRYVIDFYPGRSNIQDSSTISNRPNLAFYLDVRPALDNWEGIRMRLLKNWDEIKFRLGSNSNSNNDNDKTSSSDSSNTS